MGTPISPSRILEIYEDLGFERNGATHLGIKICNAGRAEIDFDLNIRVKLKLRKNNEELYQEFDSALGHEMEDILNFLIENGFADSND